MSEIKNIRFFNSRTFKKERYKKIIEKINHFKNLNFQAKKIKNQIIFPDFQLKKLSNNYFNI